MSAKSDLTVAEAFGGIPVTDDHLRVSYDDSSVASGELMSGVLYKVTSNNDFHFAITERGAEELTVLQGHYVTSGEQFTFGTDDKRTTFQVQRAKTGGTCYITKLLVRGL